MPGTAVKKSGGIRSLPDRSGATESAVHRCFGFLAGILTLLLLWSGCATSPRDVKSAASSASPSRDKVEEQAERSAQAHAAFAKGLHHELLKQTDLALEAFTASALADPFHHELVIEVAQRLLQKKQAVKAIEVLKKAVQTPRPQIGRAHV